MRWTARRKEEIIVSLEAGLITIADAQKRYGLSDEELAAWRRGLRCPWAARAPRHKAQADPSLPQKKGPERARFGADRGGKIGAQRV